MPRCGSLNLRKFSGLGLPREPLNLFDRRLLEYDRDSNINCEYTINSKLFDRRPLEYERDSNLHCEYTFINIGLCVLGHYLIAFIYRFVALMRTISAGALLQQNPISHN